MQPEPYHLLTDAEIAQELAALPDWQQKEEFLHMNKEFKTYADALSYVNKVSEVAERLNHHPNIMFGWGFVDIALTTTCVGGKITDKDIALAKEINTL